MNQVQKWGVYEVTLRGPSEGNPFVEQSVEGTFTSEHERVTVAGFYDGDGVYRIRFMPSFEGQYHYRVSATFPSERLEGEFTVIPPGSTNHGPVRARGFHFEYADGAPYFPLGTTAYVWHLQGASTQQTTLEELRKGYFNKIRFCVMPKHYLYNLHEPSSYPYEGSAAPFEATFSGNFYTLMGVQPGNHFDFERFNPAHFQHLEQCVQQLADMGIEADIIMMHAYDRWGFSQMTASQDALYFRYLLARLSAYRNVWWSLANEYDLLRGKTIADWERLAEIVLAHDPYHHLRSIHNCFAMYDYTRPWITHCSIQRQDVYKCAEYTDEYRIRYGKPVVLDEIAYEGDIDQGWGNISGEELVRRYWESALRGGYATHGETFDRPDGILWWSHGGVLHGESPARIRFLHDILCQTPGVGLRRMQASWDEVAATAETLGDSGYYLYYYGFNRPCRRTFSLPEGNTFAVEVIDTWDMTITDAGQHQGSFTIELPRKQYMAIRIRKIPPHHA